MATPSRPPTAATHRVVAMVHRTTEHLARLVFDLEMSGREHIPQSGPVVLAANHLSLIDPPFVGLTIRRNVRYLALEELFGRSRFFDRLTLFFGAIPISRDHPTHGPMREALRTLEEGGIIGVFPEGGRVTHWGALPPKRGAAWLALRTGAPLVPIAMTGTEGTLGLVDGRIRRTSVRVWVSEPLDPDDYLDRVDPLGAMMDDWRSAVDRRLAPWWAHRQPSGDRRTSGDGAEARLHP